MNRVTDAERRDVAKRLRALAEGPKQDWLRLAEAVYGDKFRMRAEVVGRLADLIEPPAAVHECVPGKCPINVRHDAAIDRDALLALAEEMSEVADAPCEPHDWGFMAAFWAQSIREACGEGKA